MVIVPCHADIVALLLSNGADLRYRSKYGLDTCLSLATSDEIRSVFRKWPTCIGVLVLQEVCIYHHIDCRSIIDLYQFIGK